MTNDELYALVPIGYDVDLEPVCHDGCARVCACCEFGCNTNAPYKKCEECLKDCERANRF